MTAETIVRTCPTGKVAYETEHEAAVALVGAVIKRNLGRARRHECRTYWCSACHWWHLTSKPYQPREATHE